MSNKEFFPQRPEGYPIIYAYSDTRYPGCLKVGYTTRMIDERMKEHYPTITPSISYKVELVSPAMRDDGSVFLDHDVHRILNKKHIDNVAGEWYKCGIDDVKSAIVAVQYRNDNIEDRTQTFGMRPEQKEAVEATIRYYASATREDPGRAPKFLWNAKMRFGKTFASYKLAERLRARRVLVLTFKPAVEVAWREDLMSHVDFEGWQFISRPDDPSGPKIDAQYKAADKSKPFVCFGSFQDFLGFNKDTGGIKPQHEWVREINWDLVIFDEYHFGAWKENAKKLFENEDEDTEYEFDAEKYKLEEADNAYNETFLPITTKYYLFLSGTPFRAINSGEFIEEQIYNWTYSDEQRAKDSWQEPPENPYAALPRMVMMTYQIPDSIKQIASQGEFNEFDLNVFFSAKGKGKEAKFVYENEVQKWLDLIRGAYLPSSIDDMKLGQNERPPMPYSDARLLNVLSHTLWFMPNVASCNAMYNLLQQKQNAFYHDYAINVCAGTSAGIGVDALKPVQKSMTDPLHSKSITLSCGKLTTGVTIKPWTGIFMLRNLKSPETYFQAAFRVQSPWEISSGDGKKEIMKHECYIFDFALDRALKQISDYSCRLNVNESDPEKKVGEFISFLPVLAYDGSTMKQISAQDILDITMAGTSATLLARRWESALLVNVDNDTLARLMANEEAMNALMRIEGFRSLNTDIETIINKSEKVKKAKKEGGELSKKEKKELSDEEKEYKSMRKQIQEKLIKFATRIPIFMYLTDYRERSLKDVITQLEPGLFKKVTGLDVKDFELLVSLNVFNGPLMNDAIFKFKRYEDSSLSYTGIDKHEGEDIGGWDTVVKREEYEKLFFNQQATMEAPERDENDIPDNPFMFIAEEPDEEPEPEYKQVKGKGKNSDVYIYTTPGMKVADNKGSDTGSVKAEPKTSYIALRKKQEEKKPSVDVSNVKVGTSVVHKKFGEGTVTEIANEKIYIDFEEGSKTLQFPGAFENGFLKENK